MGIWLIPGLFLLPLDPFHSSLAPSRTWCPRTGTVVLLTTLGEGWAFPAMGQRPCLSELIKPHNYVLKIWVHVQNIRKPSLCSLSAEYQLPLAEASATGTLWTICLTWAKREGADGRRLKCQQCFWGLAVQLSGGILSGRNMVPDLRGLQSHQGEKTQNHSPGFGRELSGCLAQPPVQRGKLLSKEPGFHLLVVPK